MRSAVDRLVAMVALVVLAPVLVAVGLAVRIRLGRPILFRQERTGLGGVTFTIVKFRSMLGGDGGDEARLTPFGRRLRSLSLDELPELWNVATGDMAFVGPRPLLPEYLPLYDERQRRRHEVRPGLTGLAQVSGRNALSWEERLELDVVYVENRSIRLDLRILVDTVATVLGRRGVTADDHPTMEPFTGSAGSDATS